MAGIGFELRRMIDTRQGFLNKVRAYACAGLISSGPWLMTILTLTLLNAAGPYLGGEAGWAIFRALVTYAFAFSLILQGPLQMAVTRRVADLLYGERYERVLPAFAAVLVVVGLVHAAIALVFGAVARFEPATLALAASLFTVTGMTWMALIWLSIVRRYDDVLRAYVYGTLIAMAGVMLAFLGQGTQGILGAYTAGQAFILALLVRAVVRGMESGGERDFSVLKSVVRFPLLAGVGLLYNAAIWIDKMFFWFGDGQAPHPLIRYHPLYDTCCFLAYLTVVPALAVNLVRLETSFYERYRAYYGAILGGTPLSVIEDRKQRMFRNLREGIVRLLRVQGAITVAFILFAPFVIDALELPPIAVRIFRLTCLGAFFHVLLLITILMQLYFDLRKEAFATSLLFFVLNGGLAHWSVTHGLSTFGIGYAVASFLALLLGYQLLHRALERLDYLTFVNQPIASDEDRHRVKAVPEKTKEEDAAKAVGAPADEEEEDEAEDADVPEPEPAEAPVAAEPAAAGPDEAGDADVAEPEPAEAHVAVDGDGQPAAAPAAPDGAGHADVAGAEPDIEEPVADVDDASTPDDVPLPEPVTATDVHVGAAEPPVAARTAEEPAPEPGDLTATDTRSTDTRPNAREAGTETELDVEPAGARGAVPAPPDAPVQANALWPATPETETDTRDPETDTRDPETDTREPETDTRERAPDAAGTEAQDTRTGIAALEGALGDTEAFREALEALDELEPEPPETIPPEAREETPGPGDAGAPDEPAPDEEADLEDTRTSVDRPREGGSG